ncbi:MAG: hypothetical protein HY746_00145 [Elusimicrobia bacterium]|nr:hypothetical protein [Elusimicrobiota bacterium]
MNSNIPVFDYTPDKISSAGESVIKKFFGREPDEEAFLKSIGLEQRTRSVGQRAKRVEQQMP